MTPDALLAEARARLTPLKLQIVDDQLWALGPMVEAIAVALSRLPQEIDRAGVLADALRHAIGVRRRGALDP